jgi:agmatine deiminase
VKKWRRTAIIVILYIILIMPATSSSAANGSCFMLPGEFEKQQAIWMQWPAERYTTASHCPVEPVFIDLIKALDPYVRINLISQSEEEIAKIADLLKADSCSVTHIHYYIIDHMSMWARDVGPTFVKDDKNKLHIVDFSFNNYSREASQDFIEIENKIHRQISELFRLPLVSTSLISEGGGLESNGRGTVMVTESAVLDRNPGLTKNQIENEYNRVLGARKVIWLKQGLAEDDPITKGHIDEIARFASPDTILLAQVLPDDRYANAISQTSYRRLEENYHILLRSTDQDGKPFRILRIPMPPTLYGETGDGEDGIPVRSYLNYVVTNGAVLMQTYWKPERPDKLRTVEQQVRSTLRHVFPGRQIIGIDAESVNLWGGGIHCITMHMPD